jgi:hypothetical protein
MNVEGRNMLQYNKISLWLRTSVYVASYLSFIIYRHHEDDSLRQQIGQKFKEARDNVFHLEQSFVYGVETRTLGNVLLEIIGYFCDVVLNEAGEDHLDRSCEEWSSITWRKGGK